jgi:hypothetical protein
MRRKSSRRLQSAKPDSLPRPRHPAELPEAAWDIPETFSSTIGGEGQRGDEDCGAEHERPSRNPTAAQWLQTDFAEAALWLEEVIRERRTAPRRSLPPTLLPPYRGGGRRLRPSLRHQRADCMDRVKQGSPG